MNAIQPTDKSNFKQKNKQNSLILAKSFQCTEHNQETFSKHSK